jgi:gamma-glutamyltranspeptidase/glutathione hydrolase
MHSFWCLCWYLPVTSYAGSLAGFYKGRIAEAIVEVVREEGGLLSLGDLSLHRSITTRPIHTTYRGHTIYEVPPPTQVAP